MKDEKLNIFETIRLWWKFEGRYYHKDFINGVKNLIRWFPIIWKDRDWDDSFIFNLLSQKLKNQATYIGKRDYHTLAKRDAEIMMTCVRLVEKVKMEDYGLEYMDYQETDWEFIDCADKPGYSELKFNEVSENLDEYFKKYPRQYKKVLKGEINRFKRDGDKDKKLIAMEIAHENHERARKLLFNILERNIERWWD
jgi:hypothetical protein